MAKAVWNGAVLAESDETVRVEGNHYFPRDAVNWEYFKDSETQSTCPWKGVASYYTIEVGWPGKIATRPWYYPQPSKMAAQIKDHVAFWRGVQVT